MDGADVSGVVGKIKLEINDHQMKYKLLYS